MLKMRKIGVPYNNNGASTCLADNEHFKKIFSRQSLWFTEVIMNKKGLNKVEGEGITEAWLFHGGCLTGSSLHIEDHRLAR